MIDLLSIAKTRQTYSRIHDTRGLSVTRKPPVYLVFTGDWHLGAPGTDYDLFARDLEALVRLKDRLGESLVVVGMGDYVDGYTSSGVKAEHDQVLSPWEQRLAAKKALELIKPDLVLIGDHDFWLSGGEQGYNWLHDWAMETGTPYAEWGGEIEVWTGEKVWRLLVRHRYRGSVSGLDHLRPHKALYTEAGPADAVVLAHFHTRTGAYQVSPIRRREGSYWAIQTGTYKLQDTHGRKVSSSPAEYCVPAIKLTDQKLVPYQNFLGVLDELDQKGH